MVLANKVGISNVCATWRGKRRMERRLLRMKIRKTGGTTNNVTVRLLAQAVICLSTRTDSN